MDTQDIVENWCREAIQEGFQQRIATASIDRLETWTGRVLTAATLAELFAD
jgi:hypothetical protein